MEVRADENQTDRDRHTSQRVQNRPLDLLTRNVPPTGKTDDLRGPTCDQNRYSCRNNLETWKNSCKRTVKGGKGQLNANGIEDLPCPVEMDSNKSCNVDYSNAKAATESCDSTLMANVQRGIVLQLIRSYCMRSTRINAILHGNFVRPSWGTGDLGEICISHTESSQTANMQYDMGCQCTYLEGHRDQTLVVTSNPPSFRGIQL